MYSHAWPIKLILIEHKAVAMSADDASNMDVAAKKLQIPKRGCFARIFNPAAQKICAKGFQSVRRASPRGLQTVSGEVQ